MDPRFFNFRSGRWEVEWEQLGSGSGSPPLQRTESKPSKFDYYDLLLIKELQKDATRHLVDIARTLKASDKTLEYHYRTHVVQGKLIGSYYVRWTRDIEKRLIHSVATTRLTFRGLDSEKLESVRGPITGVPFLWAEELLRDGTYIATLHIPLEDLMNTLGYIDTVAADLGSKVEIGFVRPQEASAFTIPYDLYQDDRWSLDTKQVESDLTKGYLGEVEK
jgi:DNA-binding Lrp family transcriptional regulator